jgi:hypothetical protein
MAAGRAKAGHKSSHHEELEAVSERFDRIEAVPRLLLVAVLKRRAQRARRFCSLPLAYLFLGLFMAAMMTRAGNISDAYEFDKKCVGFGAGAAARTAAALPAPPHPAPSRPPPHRTASCST